MGGITQWTQIVFFVGTLCLVLLKGNQKDDHPLVCSNAKRNSTREFPQTLFLGLEFGLRPEQAIQGDSICCMVTRETHP